MRVEPVSVNRAYMQQFEELHYCELSTAYNSMADLEPGSIRNTGCDVSIQPKCNEAAMYSLLQAGWLCVCVCVL